MKPEPRGPGPKSLLKRAKETKPMAPKIILQPGSRSPHARVRDRLSNTPVCTPDVQVETQQRTKTTIYYSGSEAAHGGDASNAVKYNEE
jgi:hypothetical protein